MNQRSTTRSARAFAVGLLACTVILAGCTKVDDQKAEDVDLGKAVAGEAPEGVFKGTTLTFAGSGGIFQDGQTEAAWTPFAERTGAKFLQDAFDPGKLKAMVESGNTTWDLVNTTQFDSARFCGTLYEELDYSQIDTSKVPKDTITDKCMVPQILYGLVLVYNTEKFGSNAPTSAADFFDTTKFPGKRTVSASPYVDPQMPEFAMVADGKDTSKITADDIAPALEKYRKLGDNLITWSSGAQAQQQLESGEAVMGLVWSGRGYGAANAGAPVKPMWDEWMVMVDSTAIPKGSKNVQAATSAINFYGGPEQQTKMSELTSYGPVNTDAKPDLSGTLGDWMTTEHLDTGHYPNVDFWVENYDALNSAWSTWVTTG